MEREKTYNHCLSASMAAGYIGLSSSTLAKMRLSGTGPAFHKLGRRVVYRPEDLDAWLASCRRTSTSDDGGDDV
jgi:predicted DNA-binding transcriptional regulator AlpA